MPLDEDCMFYGLELDDLQRKYVDSMIDNQLTIVDAHNGTGKTFLSVAVAKLLQMKLVYVFAPVQEGAMGYRPGSQTEKEMEYLSPLYSALIEIDENPSLAIYNEELARDPKLGKEIMKAAKEGKSWVFPKSHTFVRGSNIKNRFVVIDECITGENAVMVEGQDPIRIDKLYKMYKNGKSIPKALSFDETKGIFEYMPILNVVAKGTRDIVKVTAANRTIKCTPEHLFLTKNGWVKAMDLKPGVLLYMTTPNSMQALDDLNEDQYQVVLGSFLGDGSLAVVGPHKYRLRIQHGIKQLEYCTWKASMFNRETNVEYIEKNGYAQTPACRFATLTFGLEEEFNSGAKVVIPQWLIDSIDPRALAIWYMDDGTIHTKCDSATMSVCSFDDTSVDKLVARLRFFNVESKRVNYDGYNYIIINKENFSIFKKLIKPYMHASMLYKVREKVTDFYEWNNVFPENGLTVVKEVSSWDYKEPVYDIEIEKNHNFAVSSQDRRGGRRNYTGIVVHNCQNYSKKELKKVLTRIHDDCKVVMIGNKDQIDLQDPSKSGFEGYLNYFRDKPYAQVCELEHNYRGQLAQDADEF